MRVVFYFKILENQLICKDKFSLIVEYNKMLVKIKKIEFLMCTVALALSVFVFMHPRCVTLRGCVWCVVSLEPQTDSSQLASPLPCDCVRQQ